jgi:2-amino-4-hydroxy-6-hydroxymethyldihydropteridine diphosphokinase
MEKSNVFLALGSNMGDRKALIEEAIERLQPDVELVQLSPLYETEPVGYRDQEWFVNAVGLFRTSLSPQALLEKCLAVEASLKRVRTIKNGPRTIDIDIVFYGEAIIDEPGLHIPHPRMHERRFVLQPLTDIAPNAVHPILHKTITELCAALPQQEKIQRLTS